MHLIIFSVFFGPLVVAIGKDVVDVNDMPFQYCPPGCRSPVASDWILFYNPEKFFRRPATRGHPVHLTVLPEDETLVGVAKADRMFEQVLQYGFELESGATDDLENFACRGLRLAR